jgi:hypothetical protein
MPHWTLSPPDDHHKHSLPLIRTPATRPLTAIITTPDIIGCDTHFYGGHTVPCEAPDCTPCNEGVPSRWHGYLAVYNPHTQVHAILELTAAATEQLCTYHKQHQTLRGALIECRRWNQRPNGRVIVKAQTWSGAPSLLPDAPDVQAIMTTIWQLARQGTRRPKPEHHPIELASTSRGNGQSNDPARYTKPNP